MNKITKVQNEVRKVSNSILDTDFIKMQSLVVSDPTIPGMLFEVVNVPALSGKNADLVKLVPVPFYEGDKTFVPILDYDSIILDQLARRTQS